MATTSSAHNPLWTWAVPVVSWLLLGLYLVLPTMPGLPLLLCMGLLGAVIAAVHHAEVIALKVGEPFGTLVLALSVTTIEVALIVSMMLSGDPAESMALPRDTIFAAVMIILNGIIGASLLAGGRKNGVQQFNLEGVTDALCTTTVIVVIALVLPNYVTSTNGPTYTPLQMGFVAFITLALFAAFTFFQTMRHSEYFVPVPVAGESAPAHTHTPPDGRTTVFSVVFLLLSLVAVVLSAKAISPTLEALLGRWGAPATALGIIIAAIVLLPEFGAAMRAARNNRLQSSLNLAIGSAIASIGLTIPVVAILALFMGWPLELGLDGMSTALLMLSLFVVALSLRTGNTTFQPGVVHLLIFVVYLFFSFVP
jgi:Ca2+:H+ antiporter